MSTRDFEDIIYEKKDGIAKVTINRTNVMNAVRTQTLREIALALEDADLDGSIGVVVITGAGDKAFCVGGDKSESAAQGGYIGGNEYWHNKVHTALRIIPKPVIAAVNGWSVGGGNIIHMICDLSIASDRARFKQVGPMVGSFDAGFAAGYLARLVGERKAREIWFLCRSYTAQEALEMGLVNKVVPHDELEAETEKWCKEILNLSPTALKVLKYGFNADSDSIFGMENMGVACSRLYWATDEANEWKHAFWEKRQPDWKKFRR
jgi:naphthoate synthase